MNRLDYYDILPAGMDAYLSHYGWHFSKAMCYWAISNMKDREGKRVVPHQKEEIDAILASFNVEIKNNKGYDAVFVYHMGLSDYLGSSVTNNAGLARYVKDVLDDEDGYDGIAFSRFLSDCTAKGVPVIWEDMI